MIALHLWIAGAGTFFTARTIGLQWPAAAAAALAVMLGGSVPGWIHNGHLLLLYSAAWVPWAFGLADPFGPLRDAWCRTAGSLPCSYCSFSVDICRAPVPRRRAGAVLRVLRGLARPVDRARTTLDAARQFVLLAVLCASAAAFQLLPDGHAGRASRPQRPG